MSKLLIGIRSPLLRRGYSPILQCIKLNHNEASNLAIGEKDRHKPVIQKKKKTKKISSSDLRKQRNKLAVSSMKDIFGSFMGNSADDEVYEIDPKPIYADPRKFLSLNQLLQQCVLDDLTKQLKKKWTVLPNDVKQFHYFLSYGNHGPRESFPAMDSTEPPIDLPFKAHTITDMSPAPSTKVTKQKYNINLKTIGPIRLKQARKDALMNPFSKFVLFFFILLTLLNFKRDSRVQMSGKVPVNTYEQAVIENEKLQQESLQRYEEEERQRQAEKLKLEEEEKENNDDGSKLVSRNNKKWYYLWLK